MRYHQSTSAFNCGIDLHARSMYVCVVNPKGDAGRSRTRFLLGPPVSSLNPNGCLAWALR